MEKRIELPFYKFYLQNSSSKGRGIYSLEDIPSGVLIHISPILLFPSNISNNTSNYENSSENSERSESDHNNNNNNNNNNINNNITSTTTTTNNNNNNNIIQERNIEKEILSHYTYTWGNDQALALGLGSMFNHSKNNNVGFIINKVDQIISYYTIRSIKKDDELCINYGNNLWFEDSDQINNEDNEIKDSNNCCNSHNNIDDDESSEDDNFLIKSLQFE